MTGPKLNDGVGMLDGQISTRASARYLRGSASKARAVLDLIRGLDVRRADEVLQFTDRAAADDVRKVLASAVANAVHNDSQDVEELFVVACYADEGPTLKRFRPRARGRASRLQKRTCHITVIVARMSDERLEIVHARHASGPAARRAGTSAQARRERVARSRARAEGLRTGETVEGADETDAVEVADDTVAEAAPDVDVDVDVAEPSDDAQEPVSDETTESDTSADADESEESASAATTDEATAADAEEVVLPAGAVAPPEDGSIPEGYPIKGNANSMKYHEPGGRYYDITIAEVFFDTVENAEAAGYEAPAGAKPAEGSANDEANAPRGQSEAETEPAGEEESE
jgi:large subunit ribosomal protein L22